MTLTLHDVVYSVGLGVFTIALIWSWAMVGAAVGLHDNPPVEDGLDTSATGVYLSTGLGGSMEPTLSPGDRALCLSWVDYEEGDIVVIDGDAIGSSHDVRHRVVEIEDDHVVTKGDANDYRDEPVARSEVVCTVVWHE